jgi:hypothetical protein
MAHDISLKIRGIRALYSSPGLKNQTTGGNTSCIQIHDGTHTIFINAGFGVNMAGDELFAKYLKTKMPVNCTILFSDFLWDSIMGLPFFTPIHFKSTEIDILTGCHAATAEKALDDVASPLFSPFNGVAGFRSFISFRTIDSAMSLGAWTINALTLDHPLTPYPVTVWRLTHESGWDVGVILLCNPDQTSLRSVHPFLKGCKTLVCAASTSPTNDGWDQHRTGFDDALNIALNIGAQDLVLSQFHPEMTDLLLQRELLKLQSTLQLKKEQGLPNAKTLNVHLGSELENITTTIVPTMKRTA